MGWLLSTRLVSGNTAVLERRSADAPLCQRNHKNQPPHPIHPLPAKFSSFFLSSCSSTWSPASPCPRTSLLRPPQTYLRPPLRPPPPSPPWPPCPRCRRCWAGQTSPAWGPCADATRTNTPCSYRQVS